MASTNSHAQFVLRVLGIGRDFLPAVPCIFIKSYDPHASDELEALKIGGGVVRFTEYIENALAFNTEAEADEFRTREHPVYPTRSWDGEPNRPLTAFTILPQAKSDFTIQPDGSTTCDRRIIHLTA